MDLEQIKKFIAGVEWIFAKTYAKTAPHEYIVRDNLSDNDKIFFDKFAKIIERQGYVKKFYNTEFKYLNIGEKRYWHMGEVINRDDIKNEYK